MPAPKSLSLRFGLSTAFTAVVFVTSAAICTILFLNIRSVMRQDIRRTLGNAGSLGALLVDAGLHDDLQSPEDMDSEAYRSVKRALQAVRSSDPEIRFVYTLRREGQYRYTFVVDAEDSGPDMSLLGDPYELRSDAAEAAFSSPGVKVAPSFATDEWGTWLSAFAPIPGGTEAVLGIDISAASILANERKVLLLCILVTAAIFLAVALIGMAVSRRITRPLTILSEDMERIRNFDLSTELSIRSRFREISHMSMVEGNMKNGLRSFRKFVPADVVASLLARGSEAGVESRKRDLTIMFSDITDFTTISERVPTEALSGLLEPYFEGLTRIIMEAGGTVDKYIGDAIMAFWNAPADVPDHADRAVRAVCLCHDFSEELANRYAAEGKPAFRTKFGVNTGEAIVGNFGYEARLNYTAIGDNVNLASRLEGLNKLYCSRIIAGESTWEAVRGLVAGRRLDFVAVKGRNRATPIYEIRGLSAEVPAAERSVLAAYDEGMELYLAREWKGAAERFALVLSEWPADKPAGMLAERCARYAADPPGSDWDGAVRMKEK